MQFVPRKQILSLEELLLVAQAFSELGVSKIRITGGEPLVRRDITWLLTEINKLRGIEECVMTTNGSQLPKMAQQLWDAGVSRLNVSLDTLDAERFKSISRVGNLDNVLAGITAAKQAGFQRIRINTVVLKNHNHDEVDKLVQFAVDQQLDIAFIEEMPLGMVDDHNRAVTYYSSDNIKQDLEKHFQLVEEQKYLQGPARYFRIPGTNTRVGFISPHSHNFCAQCNRVRLTPEGRLLLCLGQEHSVDLRQIVRSHPGDINVLKQAILDSMAIKPQGHDFDLTTQPVILRHMNMTGG